MKRQSSFLTKELPPRRKKLVNLDHGRDEPPAHPIDAFPVQGSKIAIGRWGPSPLPGFTLEHLDLGLDLIPKTGQPNRDRDEPPAHPTDSFSVRGSKILFRSPIPNRKNQFISTLIPNFLISVQQ